MILHYVTNFLLFDNFKTIDHINPKDSSDDKPNSNLYMIFNYSYKIYLCYYAIPKMIVAARKINSLMIPKNNISTMMSSRLQFRDDFYDAQIAWNEVIKHLS